jgi:hypothetical protein
MKCSIILTGKNDNYGGHFDERLILTTKYNTKKLKKAGVDCEIIFVEWNPIEGKPLLSEKLVDTFEDIKCYVVKEDVHKQIRGQYDHMSFLEFFAKNLGIRKASGDILICTNADVFYGQPVIDFLSKGEFRDDTIYRAERRDIRFHKLRGMGDTNFDLATFRNNPVGGKPYVDASGDFTMATKKVFLDIGGYDEQQRFVKIHKDSRILFSAFKKGYDFRLIGKIYHIDHEGSAVGTSGDLSNYRPTNGPYDWKYFSNLPYENGKHWGFNGNSNEEELSKNIFNVTFSEDFDIDSYGFKDEEYILEGLSREEQIEYFKFVREEIDKLGL